MYSEAVKCVLLRLFTESGRQWGLGVQNYLVRIKLHRKICPFVENLLKNIQYFSNEMIITFYFKLIDDKKG